MSERPDDGPGPVPGEALTMDEYQRLAARTICDQAKALERVGGPEVGAEEGNFPSLAPIQLMQSLIGIQNEAGELAKIVQGWIYYGKGLSQEALIEEYGDLLWYVAEGLTAICVSMGAVGTGNIAKLRARYPDRYTDEAAANRDLEAEAAALRAGSARSAGSTPPKVDLDEDSRHRREDQKKDGQDTAPPVLPPDACRHCRGAGNVNCEWAPGMTSPCPKCGGSGKSHHGRGAAPGPAAEVDERCPVCEQRWRRFYFVDPGPCPACGAPYGGRLREEEGPLMDPNVTGTQTPPRHPVCPDGHDWQPGSCLPGSSRRCRRCGAPE
jgi:NTP pyrophosphatase (non-canonical NTP hydrolase)